MVCVITLYEEPTLNFEYEQELNITGAIDVDLNVTAKISQDIAAAILMQSPSSECISFNTFKKKTAMKIKPIKAFDISLILNRRMGLIVGCSLGFVVFFILVSILAYTKIKERQRIAKSDPAWAEMTDYHSMQSKEDILQNSTTASTDNILLGMTKKS